MNGFLIRVVKDKRYGFIKGEDGRDYFFHEADISGFYDDFAEDLEKGLEVKVTYESVPSPKGLRAGNVVRVEGV